MAKDFIKFLQKHPLKEKLLDIMEDIYYDRLDGYDVKSLVGHDGLFLSFITNVFGYHY